MSDPDQRPQLSLIEALIPIAILIVLVGLSYYLFGDAGAKGPNQVALIVATMIAVLLARYKGHTLADLNDAAVASVSSGVGAIFILFAVGALIGTWALSGTLVAMVYYGMQVLHPSYFYVSAAAICAIVSAGIGSSWTVAGTIGIGLMGISHSMELNPAITAAAVISGAYFGDTTSPLSDSTNLASATTGVDLYDHVRETALTSAVALGIALFAFWLLGKPGAFDASEKLATIERAFHITPLLFVPLVVVAVLALLKFPAFTAIFAGAIAGGVLALYVAPERVIRFAQAGDEVPRWLALLKGIWLALAGGYTSTTGYPPLDQLASRGGMASMLDTIWLVMAALAFGGIAEKAGVLERVIRPIIAAANTSIALVASLVGAVIATSIVTADQYMSIVLPGRMFKRTFSERGFAPAALSRAVGATATPTAALIPWNSCGAYMAATLGVATFDYAPYAAFNLASPLLIIALSYAGVRPLRLTEPQQQTS